MPIHSRSLGISGALAVAIVLTSVIAAGALSGDGTNDPPPRVAFVADGRNPADALAAGPIVGQVGGVLCTTSASGLSEGTVACLSEFDPELVVIVGGTGALPATLEDEIAAAVGLDASDIVRAAGADRYRTAQELGSLLGDLGLNTAYLPVDGKAASAVAADHATTASTAASASDADTLDGMDSSEFLSGPIRIAHSPLETVVLGGPLGDLTYNLGRATWTPGTLTAFVGLPLTRPLDIGPVDGDDAFAELTGLEVCFRTTSVDDEIVSISLHEQASNNPNDQVTLLTESVNWSSTDGTCRAVDVSGGVTSTGPLSLAIAYTALGNGNPHALHITGVVSVWAPPSP